VLNAQTDCWVQISANDQTPFRSERKVTFTRNPTPGEVFQMGAAPTGVAYTWVASGASGFQINVGATLALTLGNLVARMNAAGFDCSASGADFTALAPGRHGVAVQGRRRDVPGRVRPAGQVPRGGWAERVGSRRHRGRDQRPRVGGNVGGGLTMANHPGDSGDWCLDSMSPPRLTMQERIDTGISTTSAAVRAAMRAEDAFLASITGKPDTKRFTDRRSPPGRDKLLPG
jgi:hypothetical protein